MGKNKVTVPCAIVCRLVILMLLTACVAFLVPVVHAEENYNSFFEGWKWTQTDDMVRLPFLGDLIPLPSSYAGNPRGSYDGPCPIGMKGAPELRNTSLQSGALCRGACGSDCPSDRCSKVPNVIIEMDDGTCTYRNVIECKAAQGCVDHDACYDYCSEALANSMLSFLTSERFHDLCQIRCDWKCFRAYDPGTCVKWADFPGKVTTLGGGIVDFIFPPRYEFSLFLSDPPEFIKRETTPTITQPPPTLTRPTSTTVPPTVPPTGTFDVKINSLACSWTVKTGDYGVKSDCVRIVSKGTARGPIGGRLELPILAWSTDKFTCGAWTLRTGARIAVGSTCVREAGQPESTTWTVDTEGDECPLRNYFITEITHTVKIYNDDELTPQKEDSERAVCQ